MKTQKYGAGTWPVQRRGHVWEDRGGKPHLVAGIASRHLRTASEAAMSSLEERGLWGHVPDSIEGYLLIRSNGEDKDSPGYQFPKDGMYSWTTPNAAVKSTITYTEGHKDSAWMEEKDKNYLTRILKEGNLRKLEPAVWCLREMDHAQGTDIGAWWSQKLKLPNISGLLEQAEQNYKQFVEHEAREKQARTAVEKQRQEEQARVALEQQQKKELDKQIKQVKDKDQKLATLEKQSDEVKKALKPLEGQVLELQKQLEQMQKEKNELKHALTKMQSQRDSFREQARTNLSEARKATENLHQYQQQVHLLKIELEAKDKETTDSDLKIQIEKLNETIEEKQRELIKAGMQIQALSHQNKEQIRELEEQLEKERKARAKELPSLQGRIKVLEERLSKIDILSKRMDSLQKESQEAKSQLCSKIEEVKKLQERIRDKDREISNLQNKLYEINEGTEDTNQKIGELRMELDKQTKQVEEKSKETAELNKELSHLRQSYQGKEGQIKELEEAKKQQLQQLSKLQQEKQNMTKQLTELQKQLAEIKNRALNRVTKLTDQLEQKAQQIAVLTTEEEGHNEQIQSLQHQLEQIEQKTAKLQNKLEKASTTDKDKDQKLAALKKQSDEAKKALELSEVQVTEFTRQLREGVAAQKTHLKKKYQDRAQKAGIESQDLKQKLTTLESKFSEANKQLSESQSKLAKMETESKVVEKEVTKAKSEKEELQRSLLAVCTNPPRLSQNYSQIQNIVFGNVPPVVEEQDQPNISLEVEGVPIKADKEELPEAVEKMEARLRKELDEQLYQIKQEQEKLRKEIQTKEKKPNATEEVEQLELQFQELKEYKRILEQERSTKEAKRRAIERFKGNTNLWEYYHTVAIKLEEIFVSCKAARGGFVTVAAGNIGKGAQVVSLLGDIIPIPVIGDSVRAVLNIGKQVVESIDESRQKNIAEQISSLATLSELKKAIEYAARMLTEWYEPQILQLATLRNIEQQRVKQAEGSNLGKFKLVAHKLFNKSRNVVLKSEVYSPTKQLAEFAVLWLLDALKSRGISYTPRIDLGQEFVYMVTTHQEAGSFAKRVKGTVCERLGIGILPTSDGREWHIEEVYTRCGIETIQGVRYVSSISNPVIYGYCRGTQEAALKRGLQLEGTEPSSLRSKTKKSKKEAKEKSQIPPLSYIQNGDRDALTDYLNKNDQLDLQGCKLKENELEFLVSILKKNRTITSINFKGIGLNNKKIKYIVILLDGNVKLESIDLRNNKLTTEGARSILNLLRRKGNQVINVIHLDGNKKISEECISHINTLTAVNVEQRYSKPAMRQHQAQEPTRSTTPPRPSSPSSQLPLPTQILDQSDAQKPTKGAIVGIGLDNRQYRFERCTTSATDQDGNANACGINVLPVPNTNKLYNSLLGILADDQHAHYQAIIDTIAEDLPNILKENIDIIQDPEMAKRLSQLMLAWDQSQGPENTEAITRKIKAICRSQGACMDYIVHLTKTNEISPGIMIAYMIMQNKNIQIWRNDTDKSRGDELFCTPMQGYVPQSEDHGVLNVLYTGGNHFELLLPWVEDKDEQSMQAMIDEICSKFQMMRKPALEKTASLPSPNFFQPGGVSTDTRESVHQREDVDELDKDSAPQDEFYTQEEEVQPTSVKGERPTPPPKPVHIQQSFFQPAAPKIDISPLPIPTISTMSSSADRFLRAVWDGDIPTIQSLVQGGINPVDIRDSQGNNALHLAVFSNQIRDRIIGVLDYLAGRIDINITNNDGKTPMDIAQQLNNQDALEFLRGCSIGQQL